MKITLEFDSDETQLAEQSYRGPQYCAGIESFRNYLRAQRKYSDHGEAEAKLVQQIEQTFFDIFGELLDD